MFMVGNLLGLLKIPLAGCSTGCRSGQAIAEMKSEPRQTTRNMTSKMVITLFSLFAELERDLVSRRTKEALAAKKQQGITLGKPRGTIQKSKFDADQERITDLLKLGLSVRKIASLLGYKNHLALNTYINKRKLRGQW